MITKLKKELFSYILIGLMTVFIDYLLYNLFIEVFLVNSSNSKRLSFVLGAAFSFISNKLFTFKSFERKPKEIYLFILIYFTSFFLNSFIHDSLLNHTYGNYPFYIATIISTVFNYLGQKFIVFNKSESKFDIIAKFNLLQNIASNIISSFNPAIIHNIEKYWIIKKVVYLNSLEHQTGDYVEFGVFTGSSFCHAIGCFSKHEKFNPNQSKTKFIGFHSFEGFGELEEFDKHPFYVDQNFNTNYLVVKKRVKKRAKGKYQFSLVEGYFEKTLIKRPSEYGIENIRIAFIDSDTYSSSKLAFNFIKEVIKPGAHIIIDDFFSYNGDPQKGVSLAFNEFLKESGLNYRKIFDYGMGGIVIVLY